MASIIWSTVALEDVDAIAEFIARDSADNAALCINRLISMTDKLERFPDIGRVIPEIGDNSCREILYGAYRIMYRIDGDEIWITGIVHGSRDWHPEI